MRSEVTQEQASTVFMELSPKCKHGGNRVLEPITGTQDMMLEVDSYGCNWFSSSHTLVTHEAPLLTRAGKQPCPFYSFLITEGKYLLSNCTLPVSRLDTYVELRIVLNANKMLQLKDALRLDWWMFKLLLREKHSHNGILCKDLKREIKIHMLPYRQQDFKTGTKVGLRFCPSFPFSCRKVPLPSPRTVFHSDSEGNVTCDESPG